MKYSSPTREPIRMLHCFPQPINRNASTTIAELTARFNLQPHPEGGFFARSYRAETNVQAAYGQRLASTAIYFLVTPESVSRLHRIKADEVLCCIRSITFCSSALCLIFIVLDIDIAFSSLPLSPIPPPSPSRSSTSSS